MLFLFLSNVNIAFINYKLTLKLYTIIETLSTTQLVEIIDKIKFAKIALDKNVKVFIVYITFFSLKIIIIIYINQKT